MKKFFFLLGAILATACAVSPSSAPPATSDGSRLSAILTASVPQKQDSAGTPVATMPGTTLVVAHCGGAALAPENTLGAFANALKVGVDMVETDVHLSKDGELVIMHDPDVSRTTNGTGQISELTLAELKKLSAAAKYAGAGSPPQSVPTLAEVLDLVKGRADIQLEIKLTAGNVRYPGIERKVVDLIRARGMTYDVIIISFDFPTLQDIKALDAHFKTGALVNASWMSGRMRATSEQIVAEAMDASDADYFMPPSSVVTEELVRAVHARGFKLGTWTVNASGEMKRLASWGVDAITSDNPEELKRALGK